MGLIKTLTLLAGLSLTSAALAQTAPYGDEGGCARVRGEVQQTDMVFILWPDRIERHESVCRIVGLEGDINTRAVIETVCSGEGETWSASYGMTFVGDAVSIWPVDAPEFMSELRVCE